MCTDFVCSLMWDTGPNDSRHSLKCQILKPCHIFKRYFSCLHVVTLCCIMLRSHGRIGVRYIISSSYISRRIPSLLVTVKAIVFFCVVCLCVCVCMYVCMFTHMYCVYVCMLVCMIKHFFKSVRMATWLDETCRGHCVYNFLIYLCAFCCCNYCIWSVNARIMDQVQHLNFVKNTLLFAGGMECV
jgi:hypothetical protein